MKMSSKFTCRFCKEQFDQPKGLYKHLQSAHSAGASRDNRTCPICGVLCSKYEGYRDHLLYIHGQNNEGQKLTFKSLNEFLLWKTELEIKYHCKYVLQSAPKVISSKEKKYFYQCDASIPKPKPRDKKAQTAVMKTCSSVISVVEGTGVFKVEYWDSHSGHNEKAQISVQNELEAAISSVEMVNAICESDDSFDRSEGCPAPANTSSSFSPIEKQNSLRINTPTSMNNSNTPTAAKTKSLLSALKSDSAKKKAANTSVLYSLASVACGKGISKKASEKFNPSKKNNTAEKTVKVPAKSDNEQLNNFVGSPLKTKNEPLTLLATTAKSPAKTTILTTTVNTPSSDSVKSETSVKVTSASKITTSPKVTPSGPQAIAPKMTAIDNNTMNSLFSGNNVFPNQLVIVNPVGLDPNSNQNSVSSGQNIVFSLPFGQNILPSNVASQAVNNISFTGDNILKSADNNESLQVETSTVMTSSASTTTARKTFGGPQSVSTISTASTTSNITPITLTSGMKNTPVLLSSLPVGSTFMSVNNNLIPIATPSGTFLPTSLPPNIVLTPVGSSSAISNTQSYPNYSVASVSSQIVQNQMCFSVPNTPVTLSSIVKEPLNSSISLKPINTSSSSSPVPLMTPKTSKASNKTKNKSIPVNVAKISSPTKAAFGASAARSISPALNKLIAGAASGELSITTSPMPPKVSGPGKYPAQKQTKAKKRTIKDFLKSSKVPNSTVLNTVATTVANVLNAINTNVVNSSLSLAPISSIPNTVVPSVCPNVVIPPTQLNSHNGGTILFESSGDIFMLEPIDNSAVQNFTSLKSYEKPKVSMRMKPGS